MSLRTSTYAIKQISVFLATLSLSFPVFSQQSDNSQVARLLVGGSLHTCSSMNNKACADGKTVAGKEQLLFAITEQSKADYLDRLEAIPQLYKQTKSIFKHLEVSKNNRLSKRDFLRVIDEIDDSYVDALPDRQYYQLLDTFELAQVTKNGKRLKEVTDVSANKNRASNDILARIETVARQSDKPLILSITASSRDPYESADFYQSLLEFEGVESRWLPLTPALAQAITSKRCYELDSIRTQSNNFDRTRVYLDLTQAEQALCANGVDALIATIKKAQVIMLNGGDQSLTREVFFDANNKPYPWIEHVKQVPLLAGTSAGSAVQGGGSNNLGTVPMITNGTSIQGLVNGASSMPAPSQRCDLSQVCENDSNPDALTYNADGGLGSIDFAIVDTHFSERNRSVRLFEIAKAANQRFGIGVDETTALWVKGQELEVLGQAGVVIIEPLDKHSFYYSFWPAGTKYKKHKALATPRYFEPQNTSVDVSKALSEQALQAQPFEDVLTKARLRKLTQAMCLTQNKNSKGLVRAKQRTFELQFEKTSDTQYTSLNANMFGCLIDRLKVSITELPNKKEN